MVEERKGSKELTFSKDKLCTRHWVGCCIWQEGRTLERMEKGGWDEGRRGPITYFPKYPKDGIQPTAQSVQIRSEQELLMENEGC